MAKKLVLPKNLILPSEGFVRINQLLNFVPFSRTTVWRLTKTGEFPKPVRLSNAVTAWRIEDIRDWMAHAGNPQ